MRVASGIILACILALVIVTLSRDSRSSAWAGQALEFTGPGSGYVEVPDDPALTPATAITIEAWVYLRSYGGVPGGWEPTIVGKDYDQSYWLGVDRFDGSLRFYTHGGASSIDGNAALPLDTWTHVAVTYDGTTQRHYIDGVLDLESAAEPGALTASSAPLRIGSDVPWDYSPNGSIDEVRLWNVVRSPSEVAATMNTTITTPQTGLVAAWNMDGNADDAVGGHNGTLTGAARFSDTAPTPTPAPPPGGPKGDMDCDGDVDTVDALHIMRHVAGLPSTLPGGCAPVGSPAAVHGGAVIGDASFRSTVSAPPPKGDIDCDGDADAVDALHIMRHVAGLPSTIPLGCGPVGT